MINICSTFREKITYIYMAMIVIITTIIFMLLSFYKYYNDLFNQLFFNNSFFLVVSQNDYTQELSKYPNVSGIEDGIALKPNYQDKEIGTLSYAEDLEPSDDKILKWEELMLGGYDHVLVFEYDENLKENEIIVYQSQAMYYLEEELPMVIDKEISMYFQDKLINFTIKGIEKNANPGIKISRSLFDKLIAEQPIFVRRLKITDYNTALKISADFQGKEKNTDFIAGNYEYYSGDNIDEVSKLHNIIEVLNVVSIIIIFAFVIIFTHVIKNSLVDQMESISLRHILGYKKWQIKKYLLYSTILMVILSYLLSFILNGILIFIINNIFNYQLSLLNFFTMVKLVGVILVLASIVCLLFNIKRLNDNA